MVFSSYKIGGAHTTNEPNIVDKVGIFKRIFGVILGMDFFVNYYISTLKWCMNSAISNMLNVKLITEFKVMCYGYNLWF